MPPSVPVGNTGTFTFDTGVRNAGETGSVINGTVTTGNPRFTCTAGCVYDRPSGGPLGLEAGAGPQLVTITFTPLVPGAQSTSVIFPGNSGVIPVVSGVAISPIQFSPSSPLNFGQVVITKNKTLTLRISNISGTPVTLTPTIPSGPFSCASCVFLTTLNGDASQNFPITFTAVASTTVTRTMALPRDLRSRQNRYHKWCRGNANV